MLKFLFEHLDHILPMAFILAFLAIVLRNGEFGFFGWTIARKLRPVFYWGVVTLLVLVLILGVWVSFASVEDPS